MDIGAWIKPVIELGFPVVVAIYLLWNQTKQMDRFRDKMIEIRIGVYLILSKLDSVEEYESALAEFRKRKEKEDE